MRISYQETIWRIINDYPIGKEFTSHTVKDSWFDRPAGKRSHTVYVPTYEEICSMIPHDLAIKIGRLRAGPIVWRRV